MFSDAVQLYHSFATTFCEDAERKINNDIATVCVCMGQRIWADD